jgi:uncharacterized protein
LTAAPPARSFNPSSFNFAVRGRDENVAMFNASTGVIVRLNGRDTEQLTEALLDPKQVLAADDFPEDLLARLRRGGFLVGPGYDEVAAIRERYWRARGETPVVLTLTTTMNCNLGCYYCYEERSPARLELSDVPAIVELARQRVEDSGRHALHVDWYGGEPLLNLDLLEAASRALQAYCVDAGVSYVASIISNGSEWPEDVEAFVARNRIRQVQISFDGLQINHDKRRRYRKGYGAEGASSFARAVELVDRLVECARVDVRFNTDRGNQDDLLPFIEFAGKRGWFEAQFPAVLQPARLAAYSASSAFMRKQELPLEAFDVLRARARDAIGPAATIEESEAPDGLPRPKTSVCAALAANSVVVGAEGLTYRCGLQVGEIGRAVGSLSARPQGGKIGQDAGWWEAFDPTAAPSCSQCSFLPVCWGGCPKKHLEGDQHAIQEQGRYWRNNLPRLIAAAAGMADAPNLAVPLELQFR